MHGFKPPFAFGRPRRQTAHPFICNRANMAKGVVNLMKSVIPIAIAPIAIAALCAVFPIPSIAQTTHETTAEEVHAEEHARLGFGVLRQGASGNPQDLNAANTLEANVGNIPVPPLLASTAPKTTRNWENRRRQIAKLLEDNWVGRMPDNVYELRVVWTKRPAPSRKGTVTEQWIGQVIAPDGRMGPSVDAIITFPNNASNTPVFMEYSYIWAGGTMPDFGGPPPPDVVQLALDNGFTHVAYRPQMLQADGAGKMAQGVIGLTRWPREKYDWGALLAWTWGASELRKELTNDPRIDGKRISLTGHSRFGKAVLLAAAFDHKFADAHVSSAGAGGSKLMRRDFGERWENMAGSGAFHWFTPNIKTYATDETTVADLPVDAHMLIAMRAPRPLFITSGRADKGDDWVDPRGMWIATKLAQEIWDIYGLPTPSGGMPLPESREQLAFPLGWYQHGEGHVPYPAYDEFFEHEAKFSGGE